MRGLKSLLPFLWLPQAERVKTVLDKEKPQEVRIDSPLCLACIVLEEGFKSCSHLLGLKAGFESSL